MDELYHKTNKVIQEIQQCFQHLNNSQFDPATVENEIQTKISTVNANCDRLDVLVFKVPAIQRQNAKIKVDQLRYDARHLQSSLDMYQQRKQRREIEINEREQLLNRRFQPNSETAIDLDYSLQHNNQMMNAHKGIDEMLYTGNDVLTSLKDQRVKLSGARQRMMAIGSTLGLSNHTMKLIERRVQEDKWVMIVGMVVTLLIIGLIIWFFL